MTRRWLLSGCFVAVVLAAPPSVPTAGQARVGSGHALDNNLRLGSGGYNRAGRGAIGQPNAARLYQSTYSVSRPHDVRQDLYDTFLTERRYGVERQAGRYADPGRQWTGSSSRRIDTRWGASPPFAMDTPTPGTEPLPETAVRRTEPLPGTAAPRTEPIPETAVRQMEQLSYGLGFYLGQEIREGLALDGVEVTPDDVIGGFTEGLRNLEPAVPLEEIEAALAAIHEQLQARTVARLLAEDP
ncbi:MAG: FKBP-type peptidyl-prolyl cis-trans isomerase N-terminal domain-containing protein, partial [Planctomycetota bacterium]